MIRALLTWLFAVAIALIVVVALVEPVRAAGELVKNPMLADRQRRKAARMDRRGVHLQARGDALHLGEEPSRIGVLEVQNLAPNAHAGYRRCRCRPVPGTASPAGYGRSAWAHR
jgi:hypothetical protein